MGKTKKTTYVCSECGYTTAKWLGKCPNCESWSSFEEEVDLKKAFQSIENKEVSLSKISDIEIEKEFRMVTQYEEFDRVLGGGLIKGEVVLITGNPGIGKSTFLLQLSEEYSKIGAVFYISGEESPRQIKQRAKRINVNSETLYILNDTNIEKIEGAILANKPKVVVIDSIQTLYSENVSSVPGSVTQIRETTLKIIEIAKKNEIAFYIVGHITKDGKLAGPKLLEHMVDAVLQLEGEENSYYRIIRSIKNRYGSTNEISIFDMKENGISEVKNPSEFFISDREEKNIGSIITPIFEGSRVFLYEIQSLLSTPNFGIPRRTVEGYDKNRVEYYIDKFIELDDSSPRTIVYNFTDYINFIIDGHHKACASALLGEPLRCILIIPATVTKYYNIEKERNEVYLDFSSIKVSQAEIPEKYLPFVKEKRFKSKKKEIIIEDGSLNKREWEKEYLDSVKNYINLYNYAKIIDILRKEKININNNLMEEYLSNFDLVSQNKMKKIIYKLKLFDMEKSEA